ncbi:hypothetical protein [Micrococcus lylae]|uniref:hypothetical protein n=1 Tax=Micrococcus lylae TaxID=1273 RepID=UPI00117EC355|nr:hypothetical protein [Micrococcus lylae]
MRIALRLDYGAAVFGCTALVASLAVPASALDLKPDSVDALNQVSDSLIEEKYDLLGQAVNIDVSDISADDKILFQSEGSAVTVPSSPSGPVQISAEGGEYIEIYRPFGSGAEDAVGISPGVVENYGEEFTTVTSIRGGSDVQMATIIHNADSPEIYEYGLGLPEGAIAFRVRGGVLIEDLEGDLIGGFTPPWAVDAKGDPVPTSYELDGSTLVQRIDHADVEGIKYPVVADPAYSRGMIKEVKHERWANGGWELRLTVTALARWYQPFNPRYVYSEGLKDLREYHPRSMAKDTMAQQWDCHVTGLPGTINIDLESYRKSWPGWRSGILGAVLSGNPARACNW